MSTSTEDQTLKDQSPPSTSEDKKQPGDEVSAGPDVDSELDDILNSALADFDKTDKTVKNPQATGASANVKDGKSQEKQGGAEGDGIAPDELNYDFLADAMGKQFEECFSSLLKDPAVKKQFEDLSKSAEEAASSNNPAGFADTMEKALNGLNLNAENLQSDPNYQDMWEQMAQSMAEEEGAGDVPGGVPGGVPSGVPSGMPSMEGLGAMGGMFQTMVQQLLSKELLYQPLKDVSVKGMLGDTRNGNYDEYLDKNKDSLDAETSTKYHQQHDIIKKVVGHLDGDSDQHSQDEKNARFEVLLDLLQKMHELGNPPKEVVGEGNMMMPNLPDLASMGGFPGMPGGSEGGVDPSQCCLM